MIDKAAPTTDAWAPCLPTAIESDESDDGAWSSRAAHRTAAKGGDARSPTRAGGPASHTAKACRRPGQRAGTSGPSFEPDRRCHTSENALSRTCAPIETPDGTRSAPARH